MADIVICPQCGGAPRWVKSVSTFVNGQLSDRGYQFEHCGKWHFVAATAARREAVRASDPCPVCSGQRREADGTFSVRTPILEYAREVLRDLIGDYNEGRITPDTMRDCLAVLEQEMAAVATTTKENPE